MPSYSSYNVVCCTGWPGSIMRVRVGWIPASWKRMELYYYFARRTANTDNNQKFMESTLRKTLIKLQQGIELHYYKITKFNRFGCKAIFFDPNSTDLYDITVLSKSLLQLNSISQLIAENLKLYQNINNRVICPICSITEDGDILYIISQAERYRLSELVEKRQGLTEFQIIYFLIDLIELINYLKSRGLFYQIIDIDEIYLTKNMKLLIPFSIWICSVSNTKSMVLRHDDKKGYISPELLKTNEAFSADEVNSWNAGVFIYELIEGSKPFVRCNGALSYTREASQQIMQLVSKLLKRNADERLNFPLILLQSIFKKYPSLPHILPNTIFSCPPSSQYISEYCSKFQEKDQQKVTVNNKILNIQTAKIIPITATEQNQNPNYQKSSNIPIKNFKSFKSSKYIKPSDRSITQTKSYITEFVDISDSFGYGYQMNTGLICFVFNDGSQMYFENSMKKTVTYTTEKKVTNKYVYEKISEESEIKKKLFILQAYSKSIKKYKHPTPSQSQVNTKTTTATQYYRTNSASVFLLSNQTIEVIFNDRMIFILGKYSIHVQNKSSDKFEAYESIQETAELAVRKKYSITMASKLFSWECSQFEKIKPSNDQLDRTVQYETENIKNKPYKYEI